MRANLGANPSLASVSPHFSHSRWNCSLESLATPFVESPSLPAVSCGGRRWRSRMRGALYEICAIYRRWSENARRRANDVLVNRPLIRLRHLLPQQETAGGEGLSIGGTAENEPLAQPHIVPSFATNRVPAIPLSVREMQANEGLTVLRHSVGVIQRRRRGVTSPRRHWSHRSPATARRAGAGRPRAVPDGDTGGSS